jgi:hypothetical protein
MWLERTGLEQATSELVARHKARRFQTGGPLAVDLCCGVGGDATAIASAIDVIALDRDLAMCRRTRWNAQVYDVADRVLVVRGRAESFVIPLGAWLHIDPDRRRSGPTRATRVRDYEPGLDYLLALTRSTHAGAIKVGPGSDFLEHFDRPGFEIELVSSGAECKEATIWYGALVTCARRATKLPEGATWTEADGPSTASCIVGPVREWVFDPDPALTRSGLLDAFAEVHGLTRVSAGVDYLTGPMRVDSPFLQPFEVIEQFSLDRRKVGRALERLCIGPLEYKARGLDFATQQAWRRELPTKPSQDSPATLFLSGGAGPRKAIIARRS